jgi:hypothetical protein
LTAEQLPPPPVPPDAGLRDFPFMQLDVVRLRNSGLAGEANGDEFRAAILLICASWHELPAGSLPDNDLQLRRYADYGRRIEEFKTVKAGALPGWRKCSDGRLYHPLVAEKAKQAWLTRLNHR